MKKLFLPCIFIILFFCMLTHSAATFRGALNGLELWLFTVVPSLLPYMIISSYMTESGIFRYLSCILTPITKYLFRLSPNCGYVILLGFLCGYPIGSKLAADMVRKGYISTAEGQLLLSFCNNVSPAFMVTYLTGSIIRVPEATGKILLLMITTPLLCGLILSLCYRAASKSSNQSGVSTDYTATPSENANLDACISSGFENIFRLGGYIILFSILNEFIGSYLANSPLIQSRICSVLEITSGLNLYTLHDTSTVTRLIECTALCAFGGFCCIAQTASMIRGSGLKLSLYIPAKLLVALITFLFANLLF